MARTSKIKKADVLKAVKGSSGNVSLIRDRLGLKDWTSAKKHIEKYAETKQAFEDEQQIILDLAEHQLKKKIQSGEPWAIKYYLSRKGKPRGYGDEMKVVSENYEIIIEG